MTTPRIYLTAVQTGMSTRYEQCGPEDMGAEAWVPEGSGVRVKALEWGSWAHGNAIAECIFGVYCIWDGHYRPPGQQGGIPSADPKAAAQADFEARILAALEPVAQPEGNAEPHSHPETLAQIEERICSCGAGHGSGEGHMGWCDFTDYQALPPRPAEPAQPETPTPGQFTTMCLAIEDVVKGRGFDVAIPDEVKAYLRNALMVGGWRGE